MKYVITRDSRSDKFKVLFTGHGGSKPDAVWTLWTCKNGVRGKCQFDTIEAAEDHIKAIESKRKHSHEFNICFQESIPRKARKAKNITPATPVEHVTATIENSENRVIEKFKSDKKARRKTGEKKAADVVAVDSISDEELINKLDSILSS